MHIIYLKGDARQPIGDGIKIIVHICNDIGGWGKGFVLAISSKWISPERQYREWFNSGNNFRLGEVGIVNVETEIWVANIIGQTGIKRKKTGLPPIRYEAVESALEIVADFSIDIGASVHMPRIGCGLAGGNWERNQGYSL
jgi:O-acetyl-ADP-ribose deacetylase (regulator of RNase III)